MRRVDVALLLGCVSLGGCYLAHERDAPARECPVGGVPLSCVAYAASGPPVRVSPEAGFSGSVQLQSAVATPCGALVSWMTITSMPDSQGFATRPVSWTGDPIDDVRDHPALTVPSISGGLLELVRRAPASVIALVSESGSACRLLALDDVGTELAPPIALDTGYCHEAEIADDALSYLSADLGSAAGRVVTVDTNGAVLASTSLPIPSTRDLWSRARLADGTFIAYSFAESPMATYMGWLQHFDARGGAIAPEVALDANAVPVQIAPTRTGALTVWSTAQPGGLPVQARAIDANGVATAPTRDLPAQGALYGVVAVSAPDGSVLVSWLESRFGETPLWHLRAQVLDADGTARAEPTLLLHPEDSNSAPRLVIDDTGEHALAIYDDDGVWALPLACVR